MQLDASYSHLRDRTRGPLPLLSGYTRMVVMGSRISQTGSNIHCIDSIHPVDIWNEKSSISTSPKILH